jgi:hypothetical protein
MGGFNLPMFVLFLLVTAVLAVPFMVWSDFSTWVILLVAPIVSYVALFVFGFVIDFVEGRQEPYNEHDLESPEKAEEEPLVLPQRPEGLSCPSCGSENIAMILYGLPVISKELEKAIENGEVTLGGCGVHDKAPQWVCNGCTYKFGTLPTLAE